MSINANDHATGQRAPIGQDRDRNWRDIAAPNWDASLIGWVLHYPGHLTGAPEGSRIADELGEEFNRDSLGWIPADPSSTTEFNAHEQAPFNVLAVGRKEI